MKYMYIKTDKLKQFLDRYETENTKETYGITLNKFIKWTGGEIPDDDSWVDKYTSFLKSQNLKNKSINLALVVVTKFLKYAHNRETRYERLKETKAPIEVIPDEEFNKILLDAQDSFRGVLLFMSDTGCRVSETEAVSRQIFATIPREFIILGKGNKQRSVLLSKKSHEFLQHLHKNGLVFGRTWSVAMIQRQLKRLRKRNGITKKIHPHLIRHTFATRMLERGADIVEVQKMLGHNSLSTTQIYTHLTNGRLMRNWEKYQEQV